LRTDPAASWPAAIYPRAPKEVQAVGGVPSVPINVILRTVRDDLGEIFVRLRGQSIIAFSVVVAFGIIGSAPAISRNPILSEAFSLISMMTILPLEIAVFRLLIPECSHGSPAAAVSSAVPAVAPRRQMQSSVHRDFWPRSLTGIYGPLRRSA
jgi:hypothetical protein